MYYKITNGAVSFGADMVLENIDFEIREKEKIAIVGRNGCGKTTLLKCIMGKIEMEAGTGESNFSVIKNGNPTIGYLEQITFPDQSIKMIDEILKVYAPIFALEEKMNKLLKEMENNPTPKKIEQFSAISEEYENKGGYTYQKEYNSMLKVFGFTDSDREKPLSDFSGGQKTKLAFIKLLLSKPDIILLDEPTNHLDILAIEWLEGYLKSYPSALVIVSHDRMFIDKIVDVVYEIEYGETRRYPGDYSNFEKVKRVNYEKQLKDSTHQKNEIARITRVIERFRYKATKAKMVQSKIKMLEKMKIINPPNRYDLRTFNSHFQPDTPSFSLALETKKLKIGYVDTLAEVTFKLMYGEKLGIIGGNGIGKSTLLKTLVGVIPKLGGDFRLGGNTNVEYFDQQIAQNSSELTIYEDFSKEFPNLNETEVRSALGAYQFSDETVFKKISSLSGGERVRLALCKITKRRPNILFLDEPTNHLDIVGKESLENMLSNYKGTLVFVSHDRYFVNKIADKLLVFDEKGATFYPYGYKEYMEKIERENSIQTTTPNEKTKTKETPIAQKEKSFSPKKELDKKKKKIEKLENTIGEYDSQISSLKSMLDDPAVYSDFEKITTIQNEIDSLNILKTNIEEEWLILCEELEQMQEV
ncbi:MAG: ABC-F family ATP-binding cassette domain-containing protein [Clostridiales bacterium]|nr:ABC-F family ATP-binding cassette domain-containing protein [Clostridiales bacterium]